MKNRLTTKERHDIYIQATENINFNGNGICYSIKETNAKKFAPLLYGANPEYYFPELYLFDDGTGGYFWDFDEEGDNARKLGLAFMIEMTK